MKGIAVQIVCFVFFFPFSSWSQTDSSELDPITVSTSLVPEKTSKTGRNIFIIEGNKFNSLPVHSVDELLKYLPGVEVQSRGPMGAQSDIVLRGGTFQQVLVILDGLRLNDPNTGHFTSYIPIAPAEIDRIEILKGASSSIYGSEAVGGVIYIFTKSFAEKTLKKKSDFEAQITGGQYGLFSLAAGGFHQTGSTAIGGGILSNNSYGQPQRGIAGYVHNNTVSFSIGHKVNNRLGFAVRASYDDRNFAAQNFYTSFVSDTAVERVKTIWSQFQMIYDANAHHLHFDIGYKNLRDRYAFNSALAPNENTSNLAQSGITDRWNLGAKTTLVNGVQLIDRRIISNDRGSHKADEVAAFSSLIQELGTNLVFSPALRLEWNDMTGWQLVPQANLSFSWKPFQFRASAGKTIRDADFTERYNNYNKPFVSSGSLGNPDLNPETSFSYEAGMDYFSGKAFKVSTTFFQRYHNNLIDYVNTAYSDIPRKTNLSPTGHYALAENIDKVTTTGVEAAVVYNANVNSVNKLWATIGFAWLESKTSNNVVSFYVVSHARFLLNFNVNYSNDLFKISINGLYKNRPSQVAASFLTPLSSDYFVLNSKIESYILKNKLLVFAEADNICNIHYSDLLGAQMPGRWLMGGIKISLIK